MIGNYIFITIRDLLKEIPENLGSLNVSLSKKIYNNDLIVLSSIIKITRCQFSVL